jgi:hypothetical protein
MARRHVRRVLFSSGSSSISGSHFSIPGKYATKMNFPELIVFFS